MTSAMISDIESFLKWFESVNKRAMRDIGALPEEAEAWLPPEADGEKGWSVGEIVKHIAESRLYFASAYCGNGWIFDAWDQPFEGREAWLPTLQQSFEKLRELTTGTPKEWLKRRVRLIGGEGHVSGWRVLMMMSEHDVHHRSQIDTYAGMNGWEVQHIFNRTAEWVLSQQAAERQRSV
ncbi:MAG: DinB family protein [Actinomycetota bacterium]